MRTIQMSWTGICLPLLFLFFFGSIHVTSCLAAEKRENANAYLDTGLRLLRGKYKSPMQPIKMESRSIGINERLGLANVEALVILEEGYINKIGKLKRNGDAWMTTIPGKDTDDEEEEESTVTEGRIDINDVEFNSTIVFDVMGVTHRELVVGKVGRISLYLIMTMNGTTGHQDIPYFNIYDMDGVDVELKGPFDSIDRMRNIPLKIAVRFVMQSKLKQIVNSIVTRAAHSAIKGMVGDRRSRVKSPV